MKKEEGEHKIKPDGLVERYVDMTNFLQSAERIRQHLGQIIAEAAQETNTPIILATCHSHCSLGDAPGYNNALPGSDIDGLLFLTTDKITDAQREVFSASLLKKNYSWLVDLSKNDLLPDNFISLAEINQASSVSKDQSLNSKVKYSLQKILYGTKLYQAEDLDLAFLSQLPLIEQVPTATDWSVEDMPKGKRKKYEARAWFKDNFASLPPALKSVIIRLHLYFTRSSLSLIDPHLGSRNEAELKALLDLGLLDIAKDFDGTDIYRPRWIPQPWLYDITRAAMLGK